MSGPSRVYQAQKLIPCLSEEHLAMAALWLRRPAPALFLLASLCCISLSHGRTVPGLQNTSPTEPCEPDSNFSVSELSSPKTSEVQDFSSGINRIVNRAGDTDSDWLPEDHSISILQEQKWKRTAGKVAEWILHTCLVLLVLFVVFYTVSCIGACCVGLDLLAEIWRALGGCGALRALLSYFVNFEQAIAEGNAQSVPLLSNSRT